ncbi:MAG: tetratricopeptide repeat protein [Niabella sp.]
MSRIIQLEAMLKNSPDDSFLQHALALEYVKQGNDAKAKTVFEALLAANPDYVGSYYHLAKLFERSGDDQNAVKTYESGMRVALALGERHTYNELKSAYEYLTF